MDNIFGALIMIVLIATPVILTVWNLIAFILFFKKHKDRIRYKLIEIVSMCIGGFYLYMYMGLFDVTNADWNEQLYNSQLHAPIFSGAVVTITIICMIGLLCYLIARFVSVNQQSPIVTAVSIAGLYLLIGVCIAWCIQVINDFFMILVPANCILIFVKTIFILVYEKNKQIQDGEVFTKFKKIPAILNKAESLPWVALILTIPLLGILIIVLALFGQEPSSVIKAWTETADWTFSQKIPPQNIYQDQHYLCTVAAGGHKKVVKPLRTGIRHGHRVVVNRQLCIANAFEGLLQEKMPAFHKGVRWLYDKTGYPIARHIHSQYVADTIYFMMKPLEWLFLLVLYTVDINPENRIAIQYPHAAVPESN